MDLSLLSLYNNHSSKKIDIYKQIEKELDLQQIEAGLYYKKKYFKMDQEKLSNLFPFSGILDIQKKLIDIKPEEILFLDIEALGLSFQTSNYPFLIGLGYYSEEHFVMEQYLLLDISLEITYLDYIEKYLKSYPYIATYNGKKFDLPLIKSRFYYYGKQWEENFHHFDVYVLWKRLLPNKFSGGYSQKNLENKILNFSRIDDIDGSRIPQIFYDWQKYQKYDEFQQIIQHNEWDVFNLFLLFIEALDFIKNKKETLNSKIQIAKIFYKNQFYKETIKLLQNYLPANQEEMQQKYSLLYKSYYKMMDYHNTIFYLKKLIEIHKNPKEILFLIRVLQNKLKDNKQAIQYIDLLIELLQNFPLETKNPYLQIESLKKRKKKLSLL
ncbi:MAG: hypothetical protein KatS3mg129_1470 [Leptospiraceae bacterium]|nr:MAG: hypothetical protein KatS3mg129_1470 [Leptospiraceae bacterium]